MEASFADIVLGEDGAVPTLPFLQACLAITRLFGSQPTSFLAQDWT